MKKLLLTLLLFSTLLYGSPERLSEPQANVLYPHHYQVTIVSVYDGDTVTADIRIGFGLIMHSQKLRLMGINTPEVRGPEKPEGIITRDRLRELIDGKMLIMDSHGDSKGKYGRWLATLWLPQTDGTWININKWIVDNQLGEPVTY